jgi:tripartite-type tricarboxylate transporter receptor subunit TctC
MIAHRAVHWIPAASAAAALFLTAGSAGLASDYPTQNIKVVVPFASGGGVDVVARIIVPPLSVLLGQAIVIENRGGAGGALGANAVAQAAGDGYTLLLGTGSTHGTNSSVYAKLSYDPVRDFVPVALVSASPQVLVANPTVPAKTAQELIALAKSKPGELAFGSYGTGSINHLAGELFNSMAGIQANHIPYRGSAPMITDLIGGRLQYAFDGVSTTLGYIQNKTVTMLGVSSTSRSPIHPDTPAINESAIPGYDVTVWFGLVAPAKTPKTVVDLLNSKVNAVLATPEVTAGFLRLGLEPMGGGSDILSAKVQSEMQKWSKLVREKNIRIEQ